MRKINAHNPACQNTMDYSWSFIFGLVSDSQAGLVLANAPLDVFTDNMEKHRNR
ncbi:MAG: hypothetical protein ACOYMB_04385 [Patescibacteria group bacterium]